MPTLPVHTIDTAPAAAKPLLEGAKARLGFVPNLYGVFAGSPPLLEAYFKLGELVGKTGLSPVEQQVVFLAINFENGCHYCMAAHSGLAKMAKVPDDVIDALRAGTPIADAKLEALRRFAVVLNDKRGWVDDADIAALKAAGYTDTTVLEVILLMGMKVLSNYTNHIADTPVDAAFAPMKWERPTESAA